jgi:hypothetical protein
MRLLRIHEHQYRPRAIELGRDRDRRGIGADLLDQASRPDLGTRHDRSESGGAHDGVKRPHVVSYAL